MGKRVLSEIAQLPASLKAASRLNVKPLADLMRRAAGQPAVFVGSGGALAAARLAADLYSGVSGSVGYVQTPLELVARAVLTEQAGFLFTATGRHPDASASIRRLGADCKPSAVVTTNPAPQLGPLCDRHGVEVVDLGNPAGKDGFLATNSLIVTAVAMARALTGEEAPARFPLLLEDHHVSSPLSEVLVLFPPGLASVAIDIEARLTETGLAAVQIADYRNFAHGRHHGLARRAASTTVFALVDRSFRGLAERTLELLPREIEQVRLESTLAAPWDAIDLLLTSIRIAAAAGDAAGIDAGRPQVPAFGRRLYRLTTSLDGVRGQTAERRWPVRLKLRELGARPLRRVVADEYEAAFDRWLRALRATPFGAIALDYDGTVVSTEGRYELPADDVRAELNRLLDAGAVIGFASGRGDSLYQDLRQWIPRRRWVQVHLGLYNGAVLVGLDEEIPAADDRQSALDEAQRRLASLPVFGELTISDRHYQLQIAPNDASGLSVPPLAGIVTGVLRRPPPLPLEVVMSAHSLDVLPAASTKVALLERLSNVAGGFALAIGDQGQLGGNDFELLASQELTLSVDRCSPDPTRCWRLGAPLAGPHALCRYLAAIKPVSAGLRFRWRAT